MSGRKIALLLVFLLSASIICEVESQTVGYRLGRVQSYTLLKQHKKSKLFQINDNEIKDGRKILLVELVGSHYAAGYDYGVLLGKEIIDTYQIFFANDFSKKWQGTVLEMFLDWQYKSFVRKQIPEHFLEELQGIGKGAKDAHGIKNAIKIMERGITISSYPGDLSADITFSLLDQFLRQFVGNNVPLLNLIEKNLFSVMKMIKDFHNSRRIYCSFFATWGSRTEGGKLFTMRNLDWSADSGMNKYKLITVWKIDDKIPHVTLGFPIIVGSLAGMSAAGLSVHEAGLDSIRATQLGFPWTLRLRQIMMNAKNLKQAKEIWNQTKNTLGMNHMIASAVDVAVGEPAFVVETMRDYSAFFKDNDPRESGTVFTDPKTHNKFRAGYAMTQAVFRSNHAYDPKINWYLTKHPIESGSTVKRYKLLKDSFIFYNNQNHEITSQDAVNITAIAANKGGNDAYTCPGDSDQGTNVISVMFVPGEMRMYVAFQYGHKETYRTGCCGVYLEIDMRRWFQGTEILQEE